MKRTAKRCEFYAPRYYEKAARWHNRAIYEDGQGNEYVKIFGEFISVEKLTEDDTIVKEFRYV